MKRTREVEKQVCCPFLLFEMHKLLACDSRFSGSETIFCHVLLCLCGLCHCVTLHAFVHFLRLRAVCSPHSYVCMYVCMDVCVCVFDFV